MDETAAMDRALALAARGRGRVEPNPMVGAVLLRGGEVLGEGYHRAYGGPHAEVEAMADARRRGHDPAGATLCVTLEPCSHHGKTPPCADATIAAGITRVVAPLEDPFPGVAGRGFARLRGAGVAVEVGLREPEARRLNEAFLKRVTTGLPWVIAKWAQSLDGRTAAATGHSQWISKERSRAHVHRLRGRVDAVLVGVGTVIADDPSLTARPPEGETVLRVARRLVADRSGRMPADAKMLHDGGPPVAVLRGELRDELKRLAAEGVTNVLLEGGATLTGTMLADGLVDQLLVFTAPKLVGDDAATPAVRGLTCSRMDEAIACELVDVTRLGGDVLLDYRIGPRPRL